MSNIDTSIVYRCSVTTLVPLQNHVGSYVYLNSLLSSGYPLAIAYAQKDFVTVILDF